MDTLTIVSIVLILALYVLVFILIFILRKRNKEYLSESDEELSLSGFDCCNTSCSNEPIDCICFSIFLVFLPFLILANLIFTNFMRRREENDSEKLEIKQKDRIEIEISDFDKNVQQQKDEISSIIDLEKINEIDDLKELEKKYSIEIKLDDILTIDDFIRNKSQIRIDWLATATRLPMKNIVIIVRYLGRIIEDGIII